MLAYIKYFVQMLPTSKWKFLEDFGALSDDDKNAQIFGYNKFEINKLDNIKRFKKYFVVINKHMKEILSHLFLIH